MGFINVDDVNYMPIMGFTTVDLGCERGNNAYQFVQRTDSPMSQFYLNLFDQVWHDSEKLQVVTDQVLDNITNAYKENSPEFIYFVTLYNIFNEFLEDISEDVLPNEATGFKSSVIWNKLYNFQRMPLSQSLTSWKNTTAAYSPIASDSAKPSPHFL